MTLKPGTETEAYKALQDITEDLRNGTGVYQGSEGKLANSNFSPSSPVIDLTPFLTKEDRLAGSNSANSFREPLRFGAGTGTPPLHFSTKVMYC